MSLEFDGTNDYVDVGSFNMPAVAGLSIVAFVNSSFNNDRRIISKAESSAEQGHLFMLGSISSHGLKFRVRTSTTSTLEIGGGLTEGSWHWGVATYDGSDMRIFVDADEKASLAKTGALAQNSWDVWIGGLPDGAGSKWWDGFIGEVRLYRRALSVAEQKTIVACNGHDNIRDGLEHRWVLRGKEGDTASGVDSVKDLIGGEHGTPSGPVYQADRLSLLRGPF